ncbi:MAG: anhydro-N-acetylmuramic acid kinase [Oscillatoriales cyanobacterium SM2_2_1]|nr:anhydro-N-acetylmuramic acid kinase [Oscillatoriales cyanobacterium SM2_2_1]
MGRSLSPVGSIRILGLMSGTSLDGIDGAIADIEESAGQIAVHCLAAKTYGYEPNLRRRLLALAEGMPHSMAEIAELDDAVAIAFGRVARQLIEESGIQPDWLASHGQTVYHRPPDQQSFGYSVQLGRGVVLAQVAQVPTVSNFRRGDLEVGGQGAPLVPSVDALLFAEPTEHRVCQNIGGISNLTYIPNSPRREGGYVLGFDNGPGNMLIDLAVQHLFQQPFDRDGAIARLGTVDRELIQQWLQQPFFIQAPPKSAGRETFGKGYFFDRLRECQQRGLTPADVVATLTELTVWAIADSYKQFLPNYPDRVLVSGGGCHNPTLMAALSVALSPARVDSTTIFGVAPQFKEAIAFAVLGYLRLHQRCGNLPSVTGARRAALLGEIHHPLLPV